MPPRRVTADRAAAEPDLVPRDRIKAAARRLFAERGFRDVTVREIAQAVGQKNLGAVSYYFGTKDQLAAEILLDGAQAIEQMRNAFLDDLEARGGPTTIEEVVEAIVLPSARLSEEAGGDDFNRFLMLLSLNNAAMIDETLGGDHNRGYQRCLKHLRRLMPDMPLSAKNRRFVFLGAYVGSLLAIREENLVDTSRTHPTWRSESTLRDIVTTAAAILAAPVSG